MYNRGYYTLPNPWGFIKAIEYAVENGGDDNYIGFSWFGEKEDPFIKQKTAYCCPHCQKIIVDAIAEINKSADRTQRKMILKELDEKAKKSACTHYEEFEQLAHNTGESPTLKSPTERLYSYIADVAKNPSISPNSKKQITPEEKE